MRDVASPFGYALVNSVKAAPATSIRLTGIGPVVEKGSKASATTLGAMSMPSSLTHTEMYCPGDITLKGGALKPQEVVPQRLRRSGLAGRINAQLHHTPRLG